MTAFFAHRRMLILLISLAFLPVLDAQDESTAAAETAKDKEASLAFSCLYWDGVPEEKLYYREGKEYRLLSFEKAVRSRDIELKGESVFELYRDDPTPIEGQLPYELITKTAIPRSEQVLFLVIPFKDNGVISYRVVAMDDSLAAFPAGSFRFANFCGIELVLKCGEETKRLPAQQLTVIKTEKSPNGGFVPLMIGNTKGKVVFGTRIFGQPSGRELVFISPPERADSGIPRVKFISQLLPPPEPKPKPES